MTHFTGEDRRRIIIISIIIIIIIIFIISSSSSSMNIIIYCWLIAQSTVQGHLRAFHTFKFRTQVEYNTKHAHDIHEKHTNIIRKVVPSVSLS